MARTGATMLPLMNAFSGFSGGLPAGTNQGVGMKGARPGGGAPRPMTRGPQGGYDPNAAYEQYAALQGTAAIPTQQTAMPAPQAPAAPRPAGTSFFGNLAGSMTSLLGGGARPTAPVSRPSVQPQPPSIQPAQRPGQQQQPQQPQGQQGFNPQIFALMAAQQGNWQLAQQLMQGQGRPQQQQQQQQPTVGANWNPAYGGAMMAGAQYAQNNAMQNAVAQGNNSIVGGPLQSVSSPSGNNIQNNGLYQASMLNKGGGESMNQYFGDHNTQAYRLGFNGMDDPRYTAWVQSGGQSQSQGSGAASGGTGTATGTTGGKDGASAPTGTGGAAAAGTTPTQDLLGNLFNDYQAKLDASNAANEQRYSQGMNELTSLRSRSQNDINRMGAQQARDIRRDTTRTNAAAQQQATQRGLGNSTLPGIMARGVQRDSRDALNRLGDTVAGQRLNADNQLTGNISNWIYNRNDNAPDFGQLIDLARLYGESGAGQPQQNLGVPQLPPLDLSGLQGLFNGLGNLGAQLPQIGNYGGGYSTGGGGGSMPAGAYGGGNVQQQPQLSQQSQQFLGQIPGAYAQGMNQIGGAIGQGVGNFFQNPGQAIGGATNFFNQLPQAISGGVANAWNGYGNFLNNTSGMVQDIADNPNFNPQQALQGNNWLTNAIQGVNGANSWLSNLFGR